MVARPTAGEAALVAAVRWGEASRRAVCLNRTEEAVAGTEKIEQETRGLRKIGDSFRKLVVVDGVQPFYTDESGVSFVGLMDFMLNREVLA